MANANSITGNNSSTVIVSSGSTPLDQALLGNTASSASIRGPVLMSGSQQEALLDRQAQTQTQTRHRPQTRTPSPGHTTVRPSQPPTTSPASTPASVAQERKTMLQQVDTALDTVLGKGKYTQPTDHRTYTAAVGRAMRQIKTPEQREAFALQIEQAGKPFRLNFGLSRVTGGQKVPLNSKVTGNFDALHRAEQLKFARELTANPSSSGSSMRSTSSTSTTNGTTSTQQRSVAPPASQLA